MQIFLREKQHTFILDPLFAANATLWFLIILHSFKDLINDDVYISGVVLDRQRAHKRRKHRQLLAPFRKPTLCYIQQINALKCPVKPQRNDTGATPAPLLPVAMQGSSPLLTDTTQVAFCHAKIKSYSQLTYAWLWCVFPPHLLIVSTLLYTSLSAEQRGICMPQW